MTCPPFAAQRPRVRRSALAKVGAVAAVTLGAAVILTVLCVAASAVWVRRHAIGGLFTEDTVPQTPVALVLGAAVRPDGTPGSFLTARLDVAQRLYAAGTVQQLIVSGSHDAPEYDEPMSMRAYLLAAGVPDGAIIDDHAGYDTYDSCRRARDEFGVQTMIIVSQTYHLPRAVATARLLGIEAYGVGDDTVRTLKRSWRKGVLREQVACVKTIIDLTTRRRPQTGRRVH